MSTYRCLIAWLLALACLLGGCATQIQQGEIAAHRVAQIPVTRPTVVWSPLDPLLQCVGDQLRQSHIHPLVLGHGVEDTSGKTGVDVSMLANAALHKIAARGGSIRITPLGLGGKRHEDLARGINDWTGMNRVSPVEMLLPDWMVVGGVSSVANSVMSRQNSVGVGGTDLDFGGSSSASVDVANLYFGLRHFGTQEEFPGASIALTVSHQQQTQSMDGGAFVAARVDGRSYGAGLRLGRSQARSQILEDALRVGVEYGVAFLLAERFGLDLSTCPIPEVAGRGELKPDQTPKSLNQLPVYFERMTAEQRIAFARDELDALGHPIGADADGLRAAVARFQISHGIAPTGEVDTTTFYVLARNRMSRSADITKPGPASQAKLEIVTERGSAAPTAGQHLRAAVHVSVPGHLYCLLDSPTGLLPVYPIQPGRSGLVYGRSAVQLPENTNRTDGVQITLDDPGRHGLWCMLTRGDALKRIPEDLRPGGSGKGHANLDAARAAVLARVKTDVVAQGELAFSVAPKPATPPTAAAASTAHPAPAAAPVARPPTAKAPVVRRQPPTDLRPQG